MIFVHFKGQLFINGFNIGRYWPVVGPQVTLYVPAPVLLPAPQLNKIVMFELEKSPSASRSSSCSLTGKHSNKLFFSNESPVDDTIEFVDEPAIDGTCFQ